MSDDRLSALDDYLSGAMPDAEAEAFEEQLFAGDSELSFLDDLQRMSAYLIARGTFSMGHTRSEIDELMRNHSCAIVDCGTGGPTRAQVSRSAELMLTKIKVDLTGIERVDVENYIDGYGLVKTMRDLRFDPADGELWGVCETPLAVISHAHGIPIRGKVIGIVGGERRVLSESEVVVEFVD